MSNDIIRAAAIKYLTFVPPVQGQVQFVNASTFADSYSGSTTSWVVPAGVTEISGVTVDAGQPASNFSNPGGGEYKGGAGGTLSYKNAIPVTPGESLSVVRTVQGWIILQRGATPLLGQGATGQTQFSGGSSYQSPPGSFEAINGSGSGGYTQAGGSTVGASGTQRGGGGIGLLGGDTFQPQQGGSATIDGAAYGGGGSVSTTGVVSEPGARGMRLIWGAGRAYPNTNTGDV